MSKFLELINTTGISQDTTDALNQNDVNTLILIENSILNDHNMDKYISNGLLDVLFDSITDSSSLEGAREYSRLVASVSVNENHSDMISGNTGRLSSLVQFAAQDAYIHDTIIQENICCALTSLCRNAEVASCLLASDVMILAQNVLQHFVQADDVHVLVQVCSMIANVAAHSDASMSDYEVLEPLCEIINKYPDENYSASIENAVCALANAVLLDTRRVFILREATVLKINEVISRSLDLALDGGSTALLHQCARLLRNLSSVKQHVLCLWSCNIIEFVFDVIKRIVSLDYPILLEHSIAILSNMCVDARAVSSMESKDVIPFIYSLMVTASQIPCVVNDVWMKQSFILRQCCVFFAELLPIVPAYKDKLREDPKFADIFVCFRIILHVYGLDLNELIDPEVCKRSQNVLESATCTLATLTANANNKLLMHNAGLLVSIVRLIHKYDDNKLIAKFCVTALGNFSSDEATRQAVVENGVIEAIVILMGRQSGDVGVQEHAIRLLYNVCMNSDAALLAKMTACGVEEAVMSSAKTFGTHLTLQEQCILILDIISGQKTKEQVVNEADQQPAPAPVAPAKPKPVVPSVSAATAGLSNSPESWSVDDVVKWCNNVSLAEIVDVIKEKKIDGPSLRGLTPDYCKDVLELRVKPRNQLIRCRDALFGMSS